jgi:hypothetical protein
LPPITHRVHESRPFIIYALVCPLTLEVKYVGQTRDLGKRTGGAHGTGKLSGKGPLADWLRTLGYLKPYRIILERGINRRIMLPERVLRKEEMKGGYFGKRTVPAHETWLSSCVEAKWLKRFRLTIINSDKLGSISALMLVNEQLPWDEPQQTGAKDDTHS